MGNTIERVRNEAAHDYIEQASAPVNNKLDEQDIYMMRLEETVSRADILAGMVERLVGRMDEFPEDMRWVLELRAVRDWLDIWHGRPVR